MKALKRLLILAVSFVLALLAAECVCRVLPGAKSADFFEVTPWLKADFYRLAEKVGYEIIPSVSEQVNSLGMRGAERPATKPKGGFRVLVLGDSVAYGVGVGPNDTFSAKLEALLKGKASGRYVDVLNAGVSGYNTLQELEVLEKRLPLEPDVVVLSYCPNDISSTPILFKQGDAFCFYSAGSEPRTYSSFLIEHSALFRRLVVAREAAFRVAADGELSRQNNLDALRRLAASLRAKKIPLLVVIFPYLLEELTKYAPTNARLHEDVRKIIGDELKGDEGGVIDLLEVWRNRDYKSLRNRIDPSDYVHPNEDGHREAADLMSGWISQHAWK